MNTHDLLKAIQTTLLVGAFVAAPGDASAQSSAVSRTPVGSPTWAPTDFQLFTAPASTQAEFFGTVDALLPSEGPSADPYVPHDGPYDGELSANALAAGLTSQSVFDESAITLSPNAVYLAMMFVPDPGVTGSSRDFASGPIIPASLFPITRNADVYRNGVLVDSLSGVDGQFNVRNGELPFDGTSHRAYVINIYHPWDDDPTAGPLGNYELRQQYRDSQGAGWDVVARFSVVPEPSSFAVLAFSLVVLGLGASLRGRWSDRNPGSNATASR